MQSYRVAGFGSLERLVSMTETTPEPKAGEALVRVGVTSERREHAAAVPECTDMTARYERCRLEDVVAAASGNHPVTPRQCTPRRNPVLVKNLIGPTFPIL